MKYINLIKESHNYHKQMATLLQENFKAYEDSVGAHNEVEDILEQDRICIGLVDIDNLIGFIGGIPTYNGNVFELHPLVIKKSHHQKGYGSELLMEFEIEVKKRGAITIYLGSDDDFNQTSLANQDLYPDLWDKIKFIKNLNHHPYEFYTKNGYSIVGVVPDANGYGKPDIILAKRV